MQAIVMSVGPSPRPARLAGPSPRDGRARPLTSAGSPAVSRGRAPSLSARAAGGGGGGGGRSWGGSGGGGGGWWGWGSGGEESSPRRPARPAALLAVTTALHALLAPPPAAADAPPAPTPLAATAATSDPNAPRPKPLKRRLKNKGDADKKLRELTESGELSAKELKMMAYMALSEWDTKTAGRYIKVLTEGKKDADLDSDTHLIHAQLLMMTNDLTKAMKLYELVLKRDKFSPTAMEGMSAAIYRANKPEASLKFIDDRIKLAKKEDDHQGLVNSNLVKCQFFSAQGKYGEAVAICDEMSAMDPLDFRPHMAASYVKARMGDIKGMQQSYKKCKELAPPEFMGMVENLVAKVPEAGMTEEEGRKSAAARVAKVKARVAEEHAKRRAEIDALAASEAKARAGKGAEASAP